MTTVRYDNVGLPTPLYPLLGLAANMHTMIRIMLKVTGGRNDSIGNWHMSSTKRSVGTSILWITLGPPNWLETAMISTWGFGSGDESMNSDTEKKFTILPILCICSIVHLELICIQIILYTDEYRLCNDYNSICYMLK